MEHGFVAVLTHIARADPRDSRVPNSQDGGVEVELRVQAWPDENEVAGQQVSKERLAAGSGTALRECRLMGTREKAGRRGNRLRAAFRCRNR